MTKAKTYVITIRVTSKDGSKPAVRTICGDTVFVSMSEGQTAKWTVKREVR